MRVEDLTLKNLKKEDESNKNSMRRAAKNVYDSKA